MADAPDQLTLRRHRDLVERGAWPWMRRGLLALIAVPLVLALFNVFGQRATTSKAAVPEALISVNTPPHLRGGLLYGSRITIRARRDIKNAEVVLDKGWNEGITINTIAPNPVGEASRNGRLALQLGHIPAGHIYRLYIQSQVNPTNIGRRSQGVEVLDGGRRLAAIQRHVTVWP